MAEQEQEIVEPAEVGNAENAPAGATIAVHGPENASQTGESDASDIIEVRLKTLQDREVTVSISKRRTISELVEIARNQLDISNGNQRIIFQGRVVELNQTIEASGIVNGTTVHLVDRSRNSNNNTRPTVTPDRPNRPQNVLPEPILNAFRRAGTLGTFPPTEARNDPYMVLPPIRVPSAISVVPVLTSRFEPNFIYQESMSMRFRNDPPTPRAPRDSTIPPFSEDPYVITWTMKISDDQFFLPRERLMGMVEYAVHSLPFLDESVWEQTKLFWNNVTSEMRIDLPQIPSHIPSPALEKLDFMCFWTENIRKLIDKVNESEGLVETVKQVIAMTRSHATTDGLIQNRREQRIQELDEIARNLELISSELSHMKDYERERFKRNETRAYREMKIQEIPESQRNPRFYMRHALDSDYTVASREFRRQQGRFAALEELMDDILDTGAMKYAREIMTSNRDYRYQAISMFYHYVQRMRHQVSHITHVQSELDVSFLTPNCPQRLLPQYSTSLTVPLSHATTLIFKFVSQREEGVRTPLTRLIEPPRLAADVGNRVRGDWPYLPFNTPGVSPDAVLQSQRRMEDPRLPRAVVQTQAELTDDLNLQGMYFPAAVNRANRTLPDQVAIQEIVQAHQEQIEAMFAANPGFETARLRVTARPRRVMTTGDAPSVAVETQPPPVEWIATSNRRAPGTRYNFQMDRPGPETATLQRHPPSIEPTELQRISRHIAARYREDALRRIAANLTARFNEESWDTRLQNMPLCTLRESIALCLELLASAGSNLQESKELMLALVRDEEVLVRAIAESVRSLFGRGEFPTHLARIIIPRNETASARSDYEAVDGVEDSQADELETMVVRVPSDISQPQSGDLRAIRDRRASRRQFMENRGPIQSTSSTPAANAPGPSFNPEDAAEIRAGRLPAAVRMPPVTESRRRRAMRYSNSSNPAPAPSAPVAGPSLALSPNQYVVSFTSSAVLPNAPSTSTASTSSTNLNFSPSNQSPFAAPSNARQNWESGSMESPPTPRRSSAPATVTNSPVRGEMFGGPFNFTIPTSEGPVVLTAPRPSIRPANDRARAARAQIDRLAATFTGPNTPSYLPGTQNPRTTRTMPAPEPMLNNHRPMAAIDPFMICGSRHCELHRIQNPASLPDADRYTLQSLQPDPELESHLAPIRSMEQRRPEQTPEDDEDYNYDVMSSPQGSVGFQDLDGFLRFVRTMCRSILSHAIDNDTTITLNMTNISGYAAANPQELVNMVRRHVHVPNLPPVHNIPFRPSRPSAGRDARGHPRPESPIPDRNEIFRQVTERTTGDAMPGPIERLQMVNALAARHEALAHARDSAAAQAREQQARRAQAAPEMTRREQRARRLEENGGLAAMQMSANITYLVEYADGWLNPRPGVTRNPGPPGFSGHLLRISREYLTRHDFALLSRRSSAEGVLVEYGVLLRNYVRSQYLGIHGGQDITDMHDYARTFSNTREFFEQFLAQNPSIRNTIDLTASDESFFGSISTTKAFLEIEVALVKAIFTIAQMDINPSTQMRTVIHCFDLYFKRNFLMFWRLGNRDVNRQKNLMHRLPDYFASIRFGGVDNESPDRFAEFTILWQQNIDYWFESCQGASENVLDAFLRAAETGAEWNDAQATTIPMPAPGSSPSDAPSTSSAPSSSSAPSTSNTVAIPNPRKRNHDGSGQSVDGVDVVAPLMTSLSTSSPSASSVPSNVAPADDDVEMGIGSSSQ